VTARFSLDGSIIPRQVKRLFDQRAKPRIEADPATGVLHYRGGQNVVRLINESSLGVMVEFDQVPQIGEKVGIELKDWGTVEAEVRWARDGRIGLAFSTILE
jgi:hypothetical protein